MDRVLGLDVAGLRQICILLCLCCCLGCRTECYMYHDSLKYVVQDVLIKIFVRGGCLALAGQWFGSHHFLTVYLGSRNCLCKRARCCCVDSFGV